MNEKSGLKKLENEGLGVSFEIPASPTVRQQLIYKGEVGLMVSAEIFVRYWNAALTMIQNWKCEDMPDPKIDLDEISSPKAVEIIQWASMAVYGHISTLEETPKN